jgi:predicted AlkP superfamily pyrophosphatase or phosphodiesterase
MKTYIFYPMTKLMPLRFCCYLWLAFLFAFSFVLPASPIAPHVFIISIDGGKPAAISRSNMPILQKLAAEGACTWTAQTIYPSITLPSHTSMLTGVAPEKHHILWNTWKPKAGVVQVPTIFAAARQQGLSTAMFVGKEKFRHLLQPGTVDEFDFDSAQANEVLTSVVGQPAPTKSDTVPALIVAKHAADYIRREKPDLCFIHFTDADDAGHSYGWDSPRQLQALANVDTALGEVLKSIEQAGIEGESVLIITADHGGHGKTHGSRIADDMNIPWIVWGKNVKHNYAIGDPVITYDTAATALWLLHILCPPSYDGKPVTSAFSQLQSITASKPSTASHELPGKL